MHPSDSLSLQQVREKHLEAYSLMCFEVHSAPLFNPQDHATVLVAFEGPEVNLDPPPTKKLKSDPEVN